MPKITLTEFEWDIMQTLWRKSRLTARGVLELLSEDKKRAYTTIQTYLERMVKKGLLNKEKSGMQNLYAPCYSEEEIRQEETEHLVKKAFRGSYSRLAAFLFDVDSVSEKDLAQIKSMLRDKEASDE